MDVTDPAWKAEPSARQKGAADDRHHRSRRRAARGVLHLTRHAFRLASRQHWSAMACDLRAVYTAPSEQAVKERLAEFKSAWGDKYLAVTRL